MQTEKWLFIGDSITEAGRFEDVEGLGDNYVRMIRDQFAIRKTSPVPTFVNKGISGNRITDLANRWQEDVLDENPDLLSISIGVNDVWRQLDQPGMDQVTPLRFESIYRDLLNQTVASTNARIVLMEPTVIEEKRDSEGNIKLVDYVEIVQKLATEYDCQLVRTHRAFLTYLENKRSLPLTTDGVHMTSTGNALMANTWLDTVFD
ncbi:Lysophospholipase L1 [Pelagirhabdus alkalitolerans]|uniref:Lysophospholipase L1 n=1 Tax=Pelagirhabdus alkalitolerans TaxID=1612202 RepID=A0A1G6NAF4_9BACI|nr:SGNH/GDSL hydrolase family protein [Pelagirhabdus alkalitolerans]SDC64394.1 Lysophospholipase L1 [Pelagirhabdus alkalitolerans]